MPTEPVMSPAASLSTIRQELEAIEIAAARVFAGGETTVTSLMMPEGRVAVTPAG
jgi:hypothetical protein